MDLSEKRKQLEAIREARLAKQKASEQIVSQSQDAQRRSTSSPQPLNPEKVEPHVAVPVPKPTATESTVTVKRPVATTITRPAPPPGATPSTVIFSSKAPAPAAEPKTKPVESPRTNSARVKVAPPPSTTGAKEELPRRTSTPQSSAAAVSRSPAVVDNTKKVSDAAVTANPKETSTLTEGRRTTPKEGRHVDFDTSVKRTASPPAAKGRESPASMPTATRPPKSPISSAAPRTAAPVSPKTLVPTSTSSLPTVVAGAASSKSAPGGYRTPSPVGATASSKAGQDKKITIVSITPGTQATSAATKSTRPAAAAAAAAPSSREAPRPRVNGFDLFRVGTASTNPASLASTAAALCSLNAKWIFGFEQRVIRDLAVSTIPYTPGGVEASDSCAAVCITAAYSSALHSSLTANAMDSVSPTTSAPLTDRITLEVNSGVREGGLTDYSYIWGSSGNSAKAARLYAGSSASAGTREWSVEKVAMLARGAPGLVLAWILLPITGGDAATEEGEDGGAARIVAVVPLVCDSEVCTVLAHPFRPNTFLGGTRSGRIVYWTVGTDVCCWDAKQLRTRATATTGNKNVLLLFPQRPSFSTYPSPQTHQAPILCLSILGGASTHHMYSVSEDGKVCTWAAWNPMSPDATRVAFVANKGVGNVGTVAAFANVKGADAMTQLVLGTSTGAVLAGCNRDTRVVDMHFLGCSAAASRSASGAAAAATAPSSGDSKHADSAATSGTWFRGGEARSMSLQSSESSRPNLFAATAVATRQHGGMVTAVAVQPQAFGFREADCVVSSATDGTCLAWLGDSVTPLEGFGDVVTALQWSPTRSTLLAAGDAAGTVSLWDVSQSITTPVISLSLVHHQYVRSSATPGATLVKIKATNTYVDPGDDEYEVPEDELFEDALRVNATTEGNNEISARVSSLQFSSTGRWLFAGNAAGVVYVLELSKELYTA